MNLFLALGHRAAVAACIILSACAAGPGGAVPQTPTNHAYGAYLAAQYADAKGDPAAAVDFYAQSLRAEPGNTALIGPEFLAALLSGSPRAGALARSIQGNALALMLRGNLAAIHGHFAEAETDFSALPEDDATGVIKPILLAWARAGAGDAPGALAGLAPSFNANGFGPVYVLNAALIADAAHDDKDAAQLYAAAAQQPLDLRLAEILASWQARQGQMLQAGQALADFVAQSPDLQAALPGLDANITQPVVATPVQGMAEAYLTLAGGLDQPSQTVFREIFLRLALGLRPDLTAARLLLASTLTTTEAKSGPTDAQMRAALAVLQPVAPADPLYAPAAIQQADLLASLNQNQAALALLAPLAASQKTNADLQANVGDVLRGENDDAAAIAYYAKAIAAAGSPPPAAAWGYYFDRGICEDQMGDWTKAEPDLLAALALAPTQPYVLNYLGYSWALHGQHLQQAQKLLQQAVGLDPNDGAVIDSLGYVNLRLGHVKAAMGLLTQAVELDPDDPEVNGHLGDAFWQAGEKRAAAFQWQRALSLQPDAKLRAELAAKLQKNFGAPG